MILIFSMIVVIAALAALSTPAPGDLTGPERELFTGEPFISGPL
jgi:hypothetical protein